jgi:2-polyprenyl-6-methoxyphenol hydroxylase-like FAD-dependent oxidoreductase
MEASMQTTHSSWLSTDVAVIGGGVAGSSVAAVLAQAGLGVVLVEREARFRDRVRGESIHPWGIREIETLGLMDVLRAAGGHPLPFWQLYVGRAPADRFCWESIEPGLPGEWSVYHPSLQGALLDHARTCGVQILCPGRVTHFTRASELRLAVTTDATTVEVRARLVIGADGRHSSVRRWLGATAIQDPIHHQVGGCLLDGVTLDEDTFHLGRFDGGAVLVFPQGSGRARTYLIAQETIVGPLRGSAQVASYIATCAATMPENAFSAARAAGPLAFFPNADVWSDQLYADRVVLIGDAAGANDPSGGSGLSLCFRDVREVRDLLLGDADWEAAMTDFAARRQAYYSVLRAYQQWVAPLQTGVGPDADARRARAARASARDPDRGGFGRDRLLAYGPDGLVADDAARRHFLGEDVDDPSSDSATAPHAP